MDKKKRSLSLLLLLLLLFAGIAGYLNREAFLGGAVEVSVVRDAAGKYTMMVNGKPFVVRGVCYSPMPIGKDYLFNFWGDPNRPWVTDGRLMKEMGVNTVRFYKPGKNPDEVRGVVSGLYRKYRIHTMMGHYLGFWDWPPPNYADDEFKAKVREEVLAMVREYKDTPGILAWVLGNENNYSFDRELQRWTSDAIDALPTPEAQRREKARLYYSFVNELAVEVRKLDPKHPVIMGVGEVASLDLAAEHAKEIDIIGMIAYRGPGFGNLFRQIRQKFDKPVILIEYGADSFNAVTREPDERNQAEFLKLQWQDIERNIFPAKGEGNCLGGAIFEWNDEWWKGNENLPHTWSVHDEAAHWGNSSYYFDYPFESETGDRSNMNEEWFGVVSLDPKETEQGIDKRVPKKSYTVMQSLWRKK